MLPILEHQCLAQGQTQARVLAQVGAELALQGGHRVLLLIAGQIIPALNGGEPEINPLCADGVTPFAGG